MLYLDQPVQVGMSYHFLTNITSNLVTGDITILNETDTIPEQNATLLVGTYPSQDSNKTSLGTRNAAIALWHFAQEWFQQFPAYHPNDSRISLERSLTVAAMDQALSRSLRSRTRKSKMEHSSRWTATSTFSILIR